MAYNKNQVIDKIKQRYEKGQPLNITAVKREVPSLIKSAYAIKPFWGWCRAIEDAGINYADICVALNDYIICQVCGKTLKSLSGHLKRKHGYLRSDYLEDYPDAEIVSDVLRADGLYCKKRSKMKLDHWEPLWSKEYVLDKLNAYYQLGYPLNLAAFIDLDYNLLSTGCRFFGNWDNVLVALGLEPLKHRMVRHVRIYTKQEIIEKIKQRFRDGKSLDHGPALQDDSSIIKGVRRHFGLWSDALLAAGFNPKEHMRRPPGKRYPNKTSVIKAVKERKKRGEPLNRQSVQVGKYADMTLIVSAVEFIGTWDEALASAGIKRTQVTKHRKYATREAVLKMIRKRRREGKSLRSGMIFAGPNNERDLSLLVWGRKLFGNWNNALKKGGLGPDEIPRANTRSVNPKLRKYPDKASVVNEIRKRQKKGLPLKSHILSSERNPVGDYSLVSWGRKYFGSWLKALDAAGSKKS